MPREKPRTRSWATLSMPTSSITSSTRCAGQGVALREGEQVRVRRPAGVPGARIDQRPHPPHRPGQLAVGPAEHRRLSRGGPGQAEDAAHRRRLARAVRAEESGDPARLDGHGEVVDGDAGAVLLGQAVDLDHAPSMDSAAAPPGGGAPRRRPARPTVHSLRQRGTRFRTVARARGIAAARQAHAPRTPARPVRAEDRQPHRRRLRGPEGRPRPARPGRRRADHAERRAHPGQRPLAEGGPAGPVLLEDFHLREKIMHFDHERIPERVVHARGAGAHGVFTANGAAATVTRAAVLAEKGLETPVFVRFSTVLGSRGSADTVRDTRGFATKFYTKEGTWDLVGNNIPVFFIQDAIKFPDIIHAGKPHPDREIPQAQSAHDTFWDFVTLHTEATHHTIWNMSDRGIPRSYRTMEGFGVHTFRLVNAERRDRPGQVPLEAPARRALPHVGGGADRRGRRPRLPPPRPLRRHRERRLPRVGPRHPGLPRHPGGDVRGHRPARPHQDRAGGARAGAGRSARWSSTATRPTSSPRPSRWPSTPGTWCRASSGTNDPLLQAATSPTSTPS